MNIIFFGTPIYVIPILQSLIQNLNTIAVVTAPDQPTGRHQTLTPSPIKQFALSRHIPVLTPHKLSILNSQLSTLQPDLLVTAAYGKIVPQAILDLPKFGAINIHPSLLPKYRGASPVQYALLNGDTQTGISIIKMDELMDHGPILKIKTLDINPRDTFETLVTRSFKEASQILPQTILDYTTGKLTPKEQNHNQATYTKIITRQNGYIDISSLDKMNPFEIENFKFEISQKIKAYFPWPTLWTKITTKKGEKIIKFLPEEKIQIEGKKPLNKKDFLNGHPELKNLIQKILP